MLLPQICYLFRTLPVKKGHLLALSSILKKFVWKNMRPRSSHAQLLKHKYAGDMGMINLYNYFVAT